VEARSRAPRGEDLEEGKVRRGSAVGSRETGARVGTDSPDARTPEAAAVWRAGDFGRQRNAQGNGMRGRRRREAGLATGEGKPLKTESQGRYRHETRPERS
jgi:hypothetical protein